MIVSWGMGMGDVVRGMGWGYKVRFMEHGVYMEYGIWDVEYEVI